jgi:hypothetical protein
MYAELQIMGFGGGGVCGSGVLPPFEPSPYFESIWPIENNFESSPQTLSWVEIFFVHHWTYWIARGNARHSLKHVAKCL